MAERGHTRHSDTFRHTSDRKSVVFYADQPDFQQTNVVGESIGEETGGIGRCQHAAKLASRPWFFKKHSL